MKFLSSSSSSFQQLLLVLIVLNLWFSQVVESYPNGCNGHICSKSYCSPFTPMAWCFPPDSEYECDWHMCEHSCSFSNIQIDKSCLQQHNCGDQSRCRVTFYNSDELNPSYCEKWIRCGLEHKCIQYDMDCHCPEHSAHIESSRKKKKKGKNHDEL